MDSRLLHLLLRYTGFLFFFVFFPFFVRLFLTLGKYNLKEV